MAKKYKPRQPSKKSDVDAVIIRAFEAYKQEADDAKKSRMDQNKLNFDTYHLRQNWDHKLLGQSQEVVPKQAMAVEQFASFLQQGLIDIGEWFRIVPESGVDEDSLIIEPHQAQLLLQRHLNYADFLAKFVDSLKLGALGSLMIVKIHGCWEPKPKYVVEKSFKNLKLTKSLVKIDDKRWRLKIDTIRQQDFYPDPTGKGLYTLEESYEDKHSLILASEGDYGIYDLATVEKVAAEYGEEYDHKWEKSRESAQDTDMGGFRKLVKVQELWGNILDDDGNLLFENVVCTVANDRHVIRKPIPNPLWHGENPYVVAPIIRVPNSVWHRALMDSPTMLNRAINEMFNLIFDGGMMSVHGIKQLRADLLDDPSQVDEGIPPGTTLNISSTTPPGLKVMERIDTSAIPQDGLAVYNLLNQEFNIGALTNDLRMGVQPFRQVKATEVVEASQSLTGMFAGIAKEIESSFVEKILSKSWCTIAQHMDDLDDDDVKSLIGKDDAQKIKGAGNEQIFADTVSGLKFKCFGITQTLNKQKDFRKLTALLQTVSSSEVLVEEFAKKYDFGMLLGEIIKSLDIDTDKIEVDEIDRAAMEGGAGPGSEQPEPGQPGATQPGSLPNAQSQIPQAASGSLSDVAGGIPSPKFPGSRAVPGGNQ